MKIKTPKKEKIPQKLFKWLMWLKSKGYETITIEEILKRIPLSQR